MALALLTLFLPPLTASGLDNQQVSNDTITNTSKEWCEKWLTDLREPGTRVKRVRRLWDHAREAINLPPLSWTESETRFADEFATFSPGASIMRNNWTAVWFTNVWKAGSETVRVGLYEACQSGFFDCETFTDYLAPTKDSASGMLWSGSREVVRFTVVRDPLSHFLSGLAETRFRSDQECASPQCRIDHECASTQCTALARVGNSSQRPLLTLNAILAAQLPAHFFQWAAPHMWLQSGSLFHEKKRSGSHVRWPVLMSDWTTGCSDVSIGRCETA
jgi:hypothetical protein